MKCDVIYRTFLAMKDFNIQHPGIIIILEPYTAPPISYGEGVFSESSNREDSKNIHIIVLNCAIIKIKHIHQST